MDINTTIKLNNGVEMPVFGLGTYQVNHESEAYNAASAAIKAGYRHIDTAAYYWNEKDVGKAVRDSGIPRDNIFVTTKIKNDDHDDPVNAFNTSLKNLNIDYIDLFLIHWPVPQRNETWKALEKLLAEGKCKAIGVSNFTIHHLKELLEKTSIVPAVNQVEFSPYLFQKELLDFCNANKIQLEAYSPLTRGHKLNDPKLIEIAQNYNKSPAQILIRWALQHNIVVIPKSLHKERIVQNANVFDFSLSEADMEKLDSFNEDLHTCWNPTDAP